MKTSDFDFELPEELIAQVPLLDRPSSRLMIIDRKDKTIENKYFRDIIEYLNEGDVLVRNNTKVIPARIFGIKKKTLAKVEILLLKQNGDEWECLVGNAKVVKLGTEIIINEKVSAVCLQIKDEGIRILKFIYNGIFLEILQEIGNVPLPPYIKKSLLDSKRYQTVYAKKYGSSAAPTAGLHFNNDLLKRIEEKGIKILDVTLHIGLGTFKPVKTENILDHHMHSEEIFVDKNCAEELNKAKKENRRIIAVGTTSARVLETVYSKYGEFKQVNEESNIFIYPGYKFKAIDALVTNFHLPKSTLLMMVSAFASKDLILYAYKQAVESKYRFFSFGDAMLIK